MSTRRVRASAPRGYTLVELTVVVAIIAILINLALPVVVDGLYRARAARIVADFRVIRAAAVDYYASASDFPAEVGAGVEPPELSLALAGRVSWSGRSVAYDWERWYRDRAKPEAGGFVGVTVRAQDPRLVAALLRVYDGPYLYVVSDSLTFQLDTTGTDPLAGRPRKG